MTTASNSADERVRDVRCDDERLVVELVDGRSVAAPLAWYPRLQAATPIQRAHWEIAGGGVGGSRRASCSECGLRQAEILSSNSRSRCSI
ncbi:DUF2442 domain-containing protein [Caulobacter sp.]